MQVQISQNFSLKVEINLNTFQLSTFKNPHQFCTWLAKANAATFAKAQANSGLGDGIPPLSSRTITKTKNNTNCMSMELQYILGEKKNLHSHIDLCGLGYRGNI